MISFPSEDGFTLKGFEPVGFTRFPDDVRKLYYSWVLEFALRAKDRDSARGLDKDGIPYKPISEYTKRHRRSAMTPSGKGDPNAPPLIPGWQKSRTRSLLTGKAFTDRVEFFWKFDSHLGDSWARALEGQKAHGRDAFGLSPKAMMRVRAQAWERWEKWKAGKYEEAPKAPPKPLKPVTVGSHRTKYLDVMGGPRTVPANEPGFMTQEQWRAYFRQTAKVAIPGRPVNPRAKSPISGPHYTRGLAHSWAKPSPLPPPEPPTPPATISPKPGPAYRQRAYREPVMARGLIDRLWAWIKRKTG